MEKNKKENVTIDVFTKLQIVNSKKYEDFKDFLNGNLDDEKMYSFSDIDLLIKKGMSK